MYQCSDEFQMKFRIYLDFHTFLLILNVDSLLDRKENVYVRILQVVEEAYDDGT